MVNKVPKFMTASTIENKLDTGLFFANFLVGKKLSDIKYLLSQTLIQKQKAKKEGQRNTIPQMPRLRTRSTKLQL